MIEALVVDYGGVLTSSLSETLAAWYAAEGIDAVTFRSAMRALLGPDGEREAAVNPVHALERGQMRIPDFERRLADRLGALTSTRVEPDGLLRRMFAGFERADTMVEVVRRVRQAGRKTALLSNSWGLDYPREGWDELFDVTVISGEVGMRKPDAEIYRLCADRLGVLPAACVFVDDLAVNVRGAVAVGMTGVLHRDYVETVAELEPLLGMSLRS